MARSFKQELVAVFGQPVAENPTQVMIEAAFRAMGLDWRYLTIEVAPRDLPDAIRGMRAMSFRGGNCTIPHKVSVVPLLDDLTPAAQAIGGMRAMSFRGGNCTIPHKVAVVPLLDDLTPAAQAIGAVNCIVRQGDRLLGENTDGKGFLESVQALGPVAGKKAVLLGAGGAARAIGVELLRAGCAGIAVVNRSEERGRELVGVLDRAVPGKATFVSWRGDYAVPAGTDLLVNATSIGLFPDVDARVPVDEASLRPPLVVCDVIPNPPRTRLVREALARGCRALDGLGMLVNQGVIGVRLWTGRDPDPAVMRQALLEVFGS